VQFKRGIPVLSLEGLKAVNVFFYFGKIKKYCVWCKDEGNKKGRCVGGKRRVGGKCR
jgi:hypothetical protein